MHRKLSQYRLIIAREPQINKYTTKIIVKEKENNTWSSFPHLV